MQKVNCSRLFATALLGGSLIAGCAVDDDFAGAVGSSRAPLYTAAADKAIAGQYIVVLKGSVSAAATSSVMSRIAKDGKNSRVERTYSVIPGFAARLSAQALEDVLSDPAVAYVEQDQVVFANATVPTQADGIDRVDQRQGHDGQYNDHGRTGAGVHIYIVDTGIRTTHTEFTGRIGAGFTAINDGRGAEDCNGHGSHVASTAGGKNFGLARQATLHPVRVLDCNGSGSFAGVISGVDFVRNTCANQANKPCVANMSLGGGFSQAVNDAVTNAVNAGVTFAVAAGNENQNACNVSPASTPAALTVGASDDSDVRASFSNFGTCVDIFAPGVSILGSAHTSDTATQSISGTSMASPHVAGVAAQFLGANPGATPAQVEAALEGAAGTGCVTNAGTGSPNLLLFNGFGEPAFSCGGNPPPPPPPPPGDDSCVGFCGGQSDDGCFCDDLCESFGDCCPDKQAACDAPPDPNSCEDSCGTQAPGGCWCDSACSTFGDCCPDKQAFCG